MPKMLNSNPFKGRNANTPLIPNNPNNPKAQEEQAGAITLAITPTPLA